MCRSPMINELSETAHIYSRIGYKTESDPSNLRGLPIHPVPRVEYYASSLNTSTSYPETASDTSVDINLKATGLKLEMC